MDWMKIMVNDILHTDLTDAQIGQMIKIRALTTSLERELTEKELIKLFNNKKDKLNRYQMVTKQSPNSIQMVTKQSLNGVQMVTKERLNGKERKRKSRLNKKDVTCDDDVTHVRVFDSLSSLAATPKGVTTKEQQQLLILKNDKQRLEELLRRYGEMKLDLGIVSPHKIAGYIGTVRKAWLENPAEAEIAAKSLTAWEIRKKAEAVKSSAPPPTEEQDEESERLHAEWEENKSQFESLSEAEKKSCRETWLSGLPDDQRGVHENPKTKLDEKFSEIALIDFWLANREEVDHEHVLEPDVITGDATVIPKPPELVDDDIEFERMLRENKKARKSLR